MALNKDTLDEQIKKRADQRVQQRIKVFKEQILRACSELYGRSYSLYSNGAMHEDVRIACAVIASDNPRKGWPSKLWETERERVTHEVLRTMDELQKVLLVKGEPGENEPNLDDPATE